MKGRKITLEYGRKILKDYLRSVCFLSTNAFGYIGSFCVIRWVLVASLSMTLPINEILCTNHLCLYKCSFNADMLNIYWLVVEITTWSIDAISVNPRKILQHVNFLSASFLPGFVGSVLAINVERVERRPLLAVYVANVVCLIF